MVLLFYPLHFIIQVLIVLELINYQSNRFCFSCRFYCLLLITVVLVSVFLAMSKKPPLSSDRNWAAEKLCLICRI